MESRYPPWPKLDEGYADEFGVIEVEVYRVAGELWPQAAARLNAGLCDHATGLRLMLKAAALVTRVRREQPDHIHNLPAYLRSAFERLVQAEQRKSQQQAQLEQSLETAELRATAATLHNQILVEQLLSRVSEDMRLVFELQLLGYKFEEIARLLNTRPNRLRSRFHKEIKKLRRLLDS